ncbi:MAG: hypothetical protein PHQ35_01780 [Phycisphaerae bacterium]|nr:hypothetical protein [Phycisphaerae bacterium]MDD5380376.1 hypothetical protein [Phycisphaerae bacterium]
MANKFKDSELQNLPACAAEYIKLVIKKMRYRKKVRLDVQAELAAHFEDELRDCKTDEEKEQKARRLIEDFGDAKLLAVLLRRAKKRCRPLWRTVVARTLQTIGVLILFLAVYTIWFLTGKPAITVDYVAEFNRLTPPVADESLNAAPLFEQAAATCPNMPEDESGFRQKSFFDANETERQAIKDWVQLCSDSLNLIAQGTEKPYFWQQYKTSDSQDNDNSMVEVLFPNLIKFRHLTAAFCFRAQIQAIKGEYSQAFDDLIICYKFGRLAGQGEKTLVEQLVGMGIQAKAANNIREILSLYPVGNEELAVLQTDFAEAQAGQEFGIRLLFEKLAVDDEIQRCFTEDRLGGGHLYLRRLPVMEALAGGKDSSESSQDILSEISEVTRVLFFHPNKAQTKQKADEYYDFFEKISKKSPAELKLKSIDLNKQIESMIKGNLFLNIWAPALGSVYKTSYRVKANVQSAPVIIAALRFKIDKGQYPENLAELQQSGYIKEMPIDPFTEQPLVYKRTADTFTLYSVGFNFEDDSGQVYRDEKGKVKLWADEGDAVFWPVQK